MSEKKERPIMSRAVVNSGSDSIKGYLNREEFMKSLNKALKSSSLWGFATFAGLTLLGDFEKWYIGPYAAELSALVALARGYYVAKKMGAKYMQDGTSKP